MSCWSGLGEHCAFALPAMAAGFIFGLGLIFSLGPQNLMLIRAGVTRRHPLAVASTGFLSEIALATMGTAGLGAVLSDHPVVSGFVQAGCALFLALWGARILVTLDQASGHRRSDGAKSASSRLRAIAAMLAVTWLNPLVWLEAMFLSASSRRAMAAVSRRRSPPASSRHRRSSSMAGPWPARACHVTWTARLIARSSMRSPASS